SPASIKLTVGPGSAPTQQVSFTLSGPLGVPFTINASYRTIYPSVTGGQPLPQSWGSRISTNSPGLAFCKQGHPLCFGVNGQTQVTIDVDTVELLGLFAPQATVTYLVNSTVTDPANPAYFSLPVT